MSKNNKNTTSRDHDDEDYYYYDSSEVTRARRASGQPADNHYYYDYNWFEDIITVAVPTLFGLIVLVGFIGNLVVVLVVSLYRRARTATSLLMLNLAIADLVFIIVCVPTTAARYALPVWPLGSAWCKVSQISTIFVVFTSRCYAERGYEIACRLSVCLSVCNVQVP